MFILSFREKDAFVRRQLSFFPEMSCTCSRLHRLHLIALTDSYGKVQLQEKQWCLVYFQDTIATTSTRLVTNRSVPTKDSCRFELHSAQALILLVTTFH